MGRETKFPPGWGEERVRRLLTHYEDQTEEEAVAENEAAFEDEPSAHRGPEGSDPEVRRLLARHRAS